jgi:hypothetical protein
MRAKTFLLGEAAGVCRASNSRLPPLAERPATGSYVPKRTPAQAYEASRKLPLNVGAQRAA